MKPNTHYIVTWKAREHRSDPAMIAAARDLAQRLGVLRRDLWRKYGSLQAWGRKTRHGLEAEIKAALPPARYGVAYKPWIKTVEAVIDDIHMVQEAAKTAVIRKIYQRFGKDSDRMQALNSLDWMTDPVLHRWMRKAFVRGHTRVDNQIALCVGHGAKVERKNRITFVTIQGQPIEGKANRYQQIVLQFKTGRVCPNGELTLLFKSDGLWLHYAHKVKYQARANNDLLGVDKGYTEALYGRDGVAYGAGLGRFLDKTTEALNRRGKARNRLYALSKSNPAIVKNNLGRKTLEAFTNRKKATISNIVRHGVNRIFSRYGRVACEDLSRHMPTKNGAKRVNRKLSNWCKGEIQAALEQTARRTGSDLIIINPAYTSQIDSQTKTLLGHRVGDRFYRYTGDVLQADINASCNIEDRVTDPEIHRYMKAETVRAILIGRTVKYLAALGETLESAAEKGWLDPKFLAGRSGQGVRARGTRRHAAAAPEPRQPRSTLSQTDVTLSAMYHIGASCHG